MPNYWLTRTNPSPISGRKLVLSSNRLSHSDRTPNRGLLIVGVNSVRTDDVLQMATWCRLMPNYRLSQTNLSPISGSQLILFPNGPRLYSYFPPDWAGLAPRHEIHMSTMHGHRSLWPCFRVAVTSTLYGDDLLQSLYDFICRKISIPELGEINLCKFIFELTYGRGIGWEPYYLPFIVKCRQDTNSITITTNGWLLSASCLAPSVIVLKQNTKLGGCWALASFPCVWTVPLYKDAIVKIDSYSWVAMN